MKWLIIAALVYFFFPYDLLPDFLGLPGRIDDLLLMAWLAWLYRSRVRQYAAMGGRAGSADGSAGSPGSGGSRADSGAGKGAEALDAYAVLGVDRTASRDEIKAAYRSRMNEYHPDKVAHLGEALQKLAHEKSQEIQHAYQKLGGS